jgi:hypothetical protein
MKGLAKTRIGHIGAISAIENLPPGVIALGEPRVEDFPATSFSVLAIAAYRALGRADRAPEHRRRPGPVDNANRAVDIGAQPFPGEASPPISMQIAHD